MKKNKLLLMLAAMFMVVVLPGCSDDDDGFDYSDGNTRYYVLSQGQYPTGAGSVTAVKNDGSIVNNLFSQVNNRPVGQVAQSMTGINGSYYITSSNSAKIEVVNSSDFHERKTITNSIVTSFNPYEICVVNSTTAVVSDVKESTAWILDLSDNTITGSIDVGASSQSMVMAGDKLFFNCSDYNYVELPSLRVMDVADLSDPAAADVVVIDNITPSHGASLFKDSSGKVWILAEAGLLCIDPSNVNTIAKTIPLGDKSLLAYGGSRFDMKGSDLYVTLNDAGSATGIYKVSVNDTALPAAPMFQLAEGVSVYAMKISPEGNVVICDPLTYDRSGYVYEYSPTGSQLECHTVGVSPGFIYFK